MLHRFLVILVLLFGVAGGFAASAAAADDVGWVVLQARKSKEEPRVRNRRDVKKMNDELRRQGVEGMDMKSPDRWPTQVPVPSSTRLRAVSEGDSSEGAVYETNNFRFHCQQELDEEAQELVGRLFECTYAACKAVAKVLPVPRVKVKRGKNSKYQAYLFSTKADYVKAGGPPESAGVFVHKRVGDGPADNSGKIKDDSYLEDRVMVPFESLGLNAQGGVANRDVDSHTLVHEISHQNFCLNNLPIWANEGMGEYFGYVPFAGDVLDFDKCYATILLNAKSPARAALLSFDFTLEEFLTMSQEDMYRPMMAKTADTYMLATLTVVYFVHLDGRRGLRSFKAYMNELIKGTPNGKAIQKLVAPHKTAAALQEDFLAAWEKQGVRISLKDPD